ncbi:MAG: nucleoside transporter rane protein [Pedosphaera sp.]|nr:nucleoside transporter rane protein [Pedosphaera sp.]
METEQSARTVQPIALEPPKTGFRVPVNCRRSAEAILMPVGAVMLALALFGAFCAAQGANPFAVFASINRAAFGSWYSFQNTLIRAAPLMLAALCTAMPARLGYVVIGNEGALVVGGLGATAIGLAVAAWPPLMVLTAMAFAGMICGGLWITVVGALKHYRGVNETISSLLMNYIAIALLNHLVNGPMKDPSSLNKPSSYPIADENMLQSIPGTIVHWGLVYGVVACLIVWFLMEHTTFGFKAKMIGGNIRAARIAGLSVGSVGLITCFIGGAGAGLAGMVEVAAVHGRANESLNASYGYSSILVAFVARQHGLAMILVAMLLGGILASGGILQRNFHLPDATILVFQGLVFLVILFSDSLYGKFGIFQEKKA